GACGDDTKTGSPDTYDGPTCLSTTGCDAEAGYEGTVCVASQCVACETTADCAADYGDTARCSDAGRCELCDGELDCPCLEGDACTSGTCTAGTCLDCEAGAIDCACQAGDVCDAGGRCASGVCEVCPAGEAGCPCAETDPACGDGLVCMNDVCAAETCDEGTVGCPCASDDTCDDGLGCHDDNMCYTCAADAVGCSCDPAADGCSNGLLCDGDAGSETCREELTCETAGCAANQLCTEDAVGVDARCLAACAGGYHWNEMTQQCDEASNANCLDGDPNSIADACALGNRACVEKTSTVDAHCGDCLSGYLEDTSTTPAQCRAVVTCPDILATCAAQHRTCEATPETDAVCGACDGLYVEDDGACVPSDQTNCLASDDNSILADCQALHRVCEGAMPAACGGCESGYGVNPATGLCQLYGNCADLGCASLGRECDETSAFAACGDCKPGLIDTDPGNTAAACRDALTCSDLACDAGQYCVVSETPGVDASCVSSTCGDNQALDTTGACKSCGDAATQCVNEGQTGRWWYATRTNNACLCETEDGYYFDTTLSSLPQPCDQDGDGWVRASAEPFIEHPDEAVRQNARCDLRTISSVTLQNEYKQRYEVLLCAEGPVAAALGSCTAAQIVGLYEDAEIDSAAAMSENAVSFPGYLRGGVGRQLRPEEANPVTKWCVTDRADYNANGIKDIEETAGMTVPSGITLSDVEAALLPFGVFGELHKVTWEDRPGEDAGTLVIAERSRCDASFALGYDESGGSTYWKQCARNRRGGYDADDPEPGYDLAAWSCAAASGTCDPPPALTDEVPDGADVPAHGLCEVALPPSDGVWRGMSHHSQFMCGAVVATADVDQPYEIGTGEVYDKSAALAGKWAFNDCYVACPSGDNTCATDCAGSACAQSSTAAT
ncbi:MAG: hypothetical protein KC635_24790, partial [Myxococcales bacterium]|nr:hypothetical protein [Myxococcales bacterium]